MNTYSPPGAVQTYKVASKIPTVTIAQNTGSISSSNYSCQRGSSDSNDFRDFADLHDEVKKQRPNTLAFSDPPVPIVRPTISSEGPSRSATVSFNPPPPQKKSGTRCLSIDVTFLTIFSLLLNRLGERTITVERQLPNWVSRIERASKRSRLFLEGASAPAPEPPSWDR